MLFVSRFVSPGHSSMSDSEDPSSKSVDLSSLQSLFSLEFTKLYLKIADSARQQYNYAVTTKYLQLTEAAITEVS